MTEVKPICVMYYNPNLVSVTGKLDVGEINRTIQMKLYDYHVFCFPSSQSDDGSCEDVRLQVFHPKDFTEIQYRELKSMIENELEKLKP